MTREDWRKERFAFGEVTKESVYVLPNGRIKLPIPVFAVPNFKNHGNEVVSVAALARYQQAQGRGGRGLRPHRDLGHAADRRGRRASSACAPATRAAARTASRWATSSPAPTSKPR